MSRLCRLFRTMHPALTKCPRCTRDLQVICQRPPSARCPRGVFKVVPCHGCEVSRPKPRTRKPTRPQGALPSRLHLRLREELGLAALGFRSEQWVGGLLWDEVHRDAKLVVEVNGDYVHANPALHGPEDWIALGDKRYQAQTKWLSDSRKHAQLRAIGWRVLVVWESDDLGPVRAALAALLNSSHD